MAREHGKKQTSKTKRQLSGNNEREVLMIVIMQPYISIFIYFSFQGCNYI